ncbi:MAG TPA: hypothetical protein DD381_08680 [Lentisphaeria bacterium]|nr:MAG: hypothetical protein A2X47_08165 [Lentisphaerae bacterium GWF2_38_69]HBM16398.1 hypothetical protein [Lentisphaeria bacterium]
MRRLIILCIVLIIGLLIVYGIYKWGTSGSKPEIPVSKPSSSAQTEISSPQELPVPQKIVSLPDEGIPLPFKYDKTVWNDLSAVPLSKDARTGLLVNLNTREVLWAKNPKKPVPIASMTKMMTLLLIMEYMQHDPAISLDTMVQVTREASKIGGSQAWLDPKEQFSIRELLKTIVVHSANDSSYLLAQYFGNGDVQTFINKMNQRAEELHLPGAHFSNPDGLPEKNPENENKASAEDMAFLAEKLLQYPIITEFAHLKSIVFRPNSPKPNTFVNTNKLIRWDIKGVNGMKTGYTVRAGFCTTVTCTRDGKTLIAVATGFKTSKNRDKFITQLLSWGFNPPKTKRTSSDSPAKTVSNKTK